MGFYLGTSQIDVFGYSTSIYYITNDEDHLLNKSIEEYNHNYITRIGEAAFLGCTNLKTVYLPEVIIVDTYAFSYCYNLSSIIMPKISIINSYAFQYCSRISSVTFPLATFIGNFAFLKCSQLSRVNLSLIKSIQNSVFISCYNLISLNLSGVSAVPTLGNFVFTSTPIGGYSASAGQYGSIYVPASLYNDFLVAPNWSALSERFVSV